MARVARLTEIYSTTGSAIAGVSDVLVPTLTRLVLAAVLLLYFWGSASTKLGPGITGWLFPKIGAYAQIMPLKAEALGFNIAKFGTLDHLIVLAGTWAEIVLPLLIVLGLLTRLAALGMIGFVAVQTLVDAIGHRVALGSWFDGFADGIVDVRAFWVLALVVLVIMGPGPLSLDRLLGSRTTS